MKWSLSDRTKHIIKTIVTWTVVFIAYAYLIYTLCTTDFSDFIGIFETNQEGLYRKLLLYLLPLLCLMPLNIFLEAVKWRYLLRDVYPMSIREAQRQVYYGFVGAFITPYRAGEYPARLMLMRDSTRWTKAISQGIYGSVVLTAVIVLAGLGPLYADRAGLANQPWYCLLALLPLCIPPVSTIAALSLARFVVFSVQLYLMLHFVGYDLSPLEACSRIPFYYLLVTVTPNIPVSDPAIRGSWAAIAFGPLGTIAALGLWVVNTLLPTAIGVIPYYLSTRRA